MDFELTEDQATVRAAVADLAGKFDDEYWAAKDAVHEFPWEFYNAFAEGGWLGTRSPPSTAAMAWESLRRCSFSKAWPLPGWR
ncbi:hypothetical protein BH18ACT5_BH18ACT5_15800 [soil metagenome]